MGSASREWAMMKQQLRDEDAYRVEITPSQMAMQNSGWCRMGIDNERMVYVWLTEVESWKSVRTYWGGVWMSPRTGEWLWWPLARKEWEDGKRT